MMMKYFLSTLLIATLADPTAREHLSCSYLPKPTAENPEPEWATFENCALREGGEVRILPQHVAALDFEGSDLGRIFVDRQWFYVREDGVQAPVLTWDNTPDDFAEGLARTVVNGKIAYLDRSLEVVLATEHDWGWPFENGVALVCDGCRIEKAPGEEHGALVGGLWGYIDKTGREVVTMRASREEAQAALE